MIDSARQQSRAKRGADKPAAPHLAGSDVRRPWQHRLPMRPTAGRSKDRSGCYARCCNIASDKIRANRYWGRVGFGYAS